ncbi:MAG: cysteine--tRNA ligase [bacterium]|nr:cysteine--tRNA ligase [bacterium]
MLSIYNTLSNKKETFERPKKGQIKLFVCGPTVYDKTHIGHARTYIFFDVVKRYLSHLSYKVIYLQNITDVHDKITERANQERVKPLVIARRYEKYYFAAMKKLNVASVTKYARATNYIPEIIKQITILLSKGNAYIIQNDGIYFDLKSFPEYGKLSRRTTEQAEDAISRIDESVSKRNKGDFCLWKFYSGEISEPFWETKLGKGRPGWHIEDTAITEKNFGPQYDIHGGGVDLKFPHHEAEIAQQESASGKKPFVQIWMHTGALLVDGKKMSKSLGNFITVEDFLKTYSPQVLKLLVLKNHYRSPIDYSDRIAKEALIEWDNILQFLAKLNFVKKINKVSKTLSSDIETLLTKFYAEFNGAMQDDFNTSKAISSFHLIINEFQKRIYSLNIKEIKFIEQRVVNNLNLLGLEVKLPKIPAKIAILGKKRELMRSNKQFIQSDDLRKEMDTLGYTIEDTPLGSFLWPQKTSK